MSGVDRRPRFGIDPDPIHYTVANFTWLAPREVGWPDGLEPQLWQIEDLCDMVATMNAFAVLADQ